MLGEAQTTATTSTTSVTMPKASSSPRTTSESIEEPMDNGFTRTHETQDLDFDRSTFGGSFMAHVAGLWDKIAGGPTDRAYGFLGSTEALEQYIGPPISLGARAALGLFALSCLAQLITYFYLAEEASMSVNACKSFASVSKQAGYRRFGGDCKGGKKGMYTGTMALSIIAGIIYVVGLVACAFFAATLVHNKTKARARLQYLVQSGVIASGAFCSFIATILWTAATEGRRPYILSPIVWLILDLYHNYVVWSYFVTPPSMLGEAQTTVTTPGMLGEVQTTVTTPGMLGEAQTTVTTTGMLGEAQTTVTRPVGELTGVSTDRTCSTFQTGSQCIHQGQQTVDTFQRRMADNTATVTTPGMLGEAQTTVTTPGMLGEAQTTATTSTTSVTIQDQLMIKLQEYSLVHISSNLLETGFFNVKRVARMQPNHVAMLALSPGDEIEFEEMRQALEQEHGRQEESEKKQDEGSLSLSQMQQKPTEPTSNMTEAKPAAKPKASSDKPKPSSGELSQGSAVSASLGFKHSGHGSKPPKRQRERALC